MHSNDACHAREAQGFSPSSPDPFPPLEVGSGHDYLDSCFPFNFMLVRATKLYYMSRPPIITFSIHKYANIKTIARTCNNSRQYAQMEFYKTITLALRNGAFVECSSSSLLPSALESNADTDPCELPSLFDTHRHCCNRSHAFLLRCERCHRRGKQALNFIVGLQSSDVQAYQTLNCRGQVGDDGIRLNGGGGGGVDVF